MSFAAALRALRWLIWDTFRQSLASYAFWLLLVLNVLCIVFCFSISIVETGPLHLRDDIAINPDRGYLSIGFGMVYLPLPRDPASEVAFLQTLVANWGAGAIGVLLALIWTAGFMPTFLEAGSATVLFAKPIPRWFLVVGKFIGVVLFVAFEMAVLIGGTWLAFGLRTDIWLSAYLLSFPLVMLQFLIVYSFSVLIAVCTRSTVAAVFAAILFWMMCYGMNYGRHRTFAEPYLDYGQRRAARVDAYKRRLDRMRPTLISLGDARFNLRPPVEFPRELAPFATTPVVGPASSAGLGRGVVQVEMLEMLYHIEPIGARPGEASPHRDMAVIFQQLARKLHAPPPPGELPAGGGITRWPAEVGYWILPKPADLNILMQQALDSRRHFVAPEEYDIVRTQGGFQPLLSVTTSLLFSLLILVIAARQVNAINY